jgi:hypothetical protein
MKGESDDMSVASAVDLIRATPPSRRVRSRRKSGVGESSATDRPAVEILRHSDGNWNTVGKRQDSDNTRQNSGCLGQVNGG